MPLINKLLYKYAETKPTFSGDCAFFGNDDKGWIEIYENGTITIPEGITKLCDIYLLTNGSEGTGDKFTSNETTAGYTWVDYYGTGGTGGTAMEYYGKTLSGKYTIVIEDTSTRMSGKINFATTTLTTDATGNIPGAEGGYGYTETSFTSSETHQTTVTTNEAQPGKDGRRPFTGHTPMNDGHCKLLLAAGGNGGRYRGDSPADYTPNSTSRYKNCGAGGDGENNQKGWPGIVIIRWGY